MRAPFVITCSAILSLGTGLSEHASAQTPEAVQTEAVQAEAPQLEASQTAARRTLTLDAALDAAKRSQPRLTQARANTAASRARVDQAGSGLWPQVSANVGYQHTEGEDRTVVGTGTAGTTGTVVSGSRNYFNASLSASQLIWDFGQTVGRKRAAAASAEASAKSEHTAAQDVALDVRLSFFTARAQRALVEVASETLANQQRHLQQIQAFVTVGTRPEIDLAQARTDLANARVQLINAENGYETAKAQLNLAMGVEGPTDFDVAPEPSHALDGEDLTLDALLDEAIRARPELATLAQQLRAEELSLAATRGEYWPSFNASTSLSEAGSSLDELGWSWTLQVGLQWPLYQGGLTNARVDEARANLTGLGAQIDGQRQQIRLELEQARFGVRGAKAAIEAAAEAVKNARERLRLAEGRYQTGVGNVIELGDAQVALTSAEAQHVQADYALAEARARLVRALGRS